MLTHLLLLLFFSHCVGLFVIPWTVCSLPGSSVHGTSQARILEWVAISSPIHVLERIVISVSENMK